MNHDVNENNYTKIIGSNKQIVGRAPVNNNTLHTATDIPLKTVIKFWIFPDLTLINSDIELVFSW